MAPTLGRQRRPRPADETRRAVLDAAERCFTRYGIRQTTIDDIVREAAVPRATLYRHAGSRDDLLLAVTLREIDRVIDELDTALVVRTTVADTIVGGVLRAVSAVEQSPLLRSLLVGAAPLGADDLSQPALAGLLDRLGTFIEPALTAGQRAGVVRAELTVPVAVEHLVRTIHSQVSFVVRPGQSDAQRRDYLERVLVPVFTA